MDAAISGKDPWGFLLFPEAVQVYSGYDFALMFRSKYSYKTVE